MERHSSSQRHLLSPLRLGISITTGHCRIDVRLRIWLLQLMVLVLIPKAVCGSHVRIFLTVTQADGCVLQMVERSSRLFRSTIRTRALTLACSEGSMGGIYICVNRRSWVEKDFRGMVESGKFVSKSQEQKTSFRDLRCAKSFCGWFRRGIHPA